MVIVLVVIALLPGFITTYIIAMKSARYYAKNVIRDVGSQPVYAAEGR